MTTPYRPLPDVPAFSFWRRVVAMMPGTGPSQRRARGGLWFNLAGLGWRDVSTWRCRDRSACQVRPEDHGPVMPPWSFPLARCAVVWLGVVAFNVALLIHHVTSLRWRVLWTGNVDHVLVALQWYRLGCIPLSLFGIVAGLISARRAQRQRSFWPVRGEPHAKTEV